MIQRKHIYSIETVPFSCQQWLKKLTKEEEKLTVPILYSYSYFVAIDVLSNNYSDTNIGSSQTILNFDPLKPSTKWEVPN